MNISPVTFDEAPPARYDRVQVLIRLLMLLVLAVLGGSLGWLYLLLYLALPLVAAAWVGNRAPSEFFARGAPLLTQLLRWIVAFLAYLAFLTDEFPGDRAADSVRFEVAPGGSPTVGSALARLLTDLPGFVLGAFVGCFGIVVSVVAAVFVLVEQRVPASVFNFQRGVVRWQARLFACHASLVEAPAPLEFDSTAYGSSPGGAS